MKVFDFPEWGEKCRGCYIIHAMNVRNVGKETGSRSIAEIIHSDLMSKRLCLIR